MEASTKVVCMPSKAGVDSNVPGAAPNATPNITISKATTRPFLRPRLTSTPAIHLHCTQSLNSLTRSIAASVVKHIKADPPVLAIP
jgi:hypothetical protein